MSKVKELIKKIPAPTGRIKLALFALWTLFFLWSGWWLRGVYERAQDAAALKDSVKQEQVQAGVSADAILSGRSQAAAAQAANQGATNESKTRIDKVYIRVPVPADCSVPDGVRNELEAAQERANGAVRAATSAAAARDP